MNATKRIIISGGSGFLGTSLAGYLTGSNYEVVILSRNPKPSRNGIRYATWDGKTLGAWTQELEGAFAIINLAGKSVDCRYHQKNKDEILNSRLDSTAIIGEAIKQTNTRPQIWFNASSATIYRDSRDKFMDENTGEVGNDFSMNVCKAWEKVFFECHIPNIRKVALRTSIVLGRHGGAFQPLVNLAKVGLGGSQGDGGQFFSWLHIDDFNRIILFLLNNHQINGVVNCVAPKPVENHVLMKILRKETKVSFGIPLPKLLLSIGAFMIRTETELILKSRKVIPKRLTELGFKFKFNTLDKAIHDLLDKKQTNSSKNGVTDVALPQM